MDAAQLESLSMKLGGPVAVDDPMALREALSETLRIENEARLQPEAESTRTSG